MRTRSAYRDSIPTDTEGNSNKGACDSPANEHGIVGREYKDINISAPRKLGRNSFPSFGSSLEKKALVVTNAGQTSDGNVRREKKIACKENTPPRSKRPHSTFSREETAEVEKKRKYLEVIDHHELLIE